MNDHDQQLLKDYTWSAYCQVPQSLKPKLEAILLTEIVASSEGRLSDDFLVWKKCAQLIGENERFRQDLLKCWEDGSFDVIRSSDLLRGERPQLQTTPAISEPGPQTINIYGANMTEVHGNFISCETNEDEKIKKWLCGRDYRAIQLDLSSKRVNDTGTWFLKTLEFEKWMNSDEARILWCPGMPGVGKTVISSLVVDHLQDLNVGAVCFVFCNYKQYSEQNLAHVLSTILRQLFEQNPAQAMPIRRLYQKHNAKTSPSVHELVEAAKQTIYSLERAYLILDALDEFTEKYSDKIVFTLIQQLMDVTPQLQIMATSRVLGAMESFFLQLNAIRKEILSTDEDVERCLQSHIEDKLSFVSEHKQTIIDRIMQVARGRILLAILHVNSLSHLLSWGEVSDALNCLPGQIDLAYDRVMRRIDTQDEQRKKLAYRVLFWVVHSRRSLKSNELQHALAVSPGRARIQDYICPLETISGVCAGLIIVEYYQPVRFIHETAQSFFDSQRDKYFDEAQSTVTESLFHYLSPFSFDDLIHCRIHAFEYPLMNYITEFWYAHLQQEEKRLFPTQGTFEFWKEGIYRCLHLSSHYSVMKSSEDELDEKSNVVWNPSSGFISFTVFQSEAEVPSIISNIHLAAACDLPHTLTMLLDNGNSPNIRTNDYHRYTALEIAVDFGAPRTSKILVQEIMHRGEWPSTDHGRIFALAAKNGMLDLVNALLSEPGLDINARDPRDRTALKNAALYGHVAVFNMLLQHKEVDVNAYSRSFPPTVLWAALRSSSLKNKEIRSNIILSILSDDRFNINAGPTGLSELGDVTPAVYHLICQKYRAQFLADTGITLLAHAANCGMLEIVRNILTQSPSEIDQIGHKGCTPLVYAVFRNQVDVVKYLMSCQPSPDIEFKDPDGNTCMILAILDDKLEMAETLIAHGASTSVRAQGGKTLLHLAIDCPLINHENTVGDKWTKRLAMPLLDCGVEVDGMDNDGRTPLFLAAVQGSRILLEMLLLRGANIHAVDHNLRTPLSYAVGTSDLDKVKSGPPLKLFSKRRWSAIHLLLERGAHLEAKEKDGMTPLKRAESVGDEFILQCLRRFLSGELPSEDAIALTQEEDRMWGYIHREENEEQDASYRLLVDVTLL